MGRLSPHRDRYKLLGLLWLSLYLCMMFCDCVHGVYSFVDEQYFVMEGETITITMERSAGTGVCNVDVDDNVGRLRQDGVTENDFDSDNDFIFNFLLNSASAQRDISAAHDGIAFEGIECFDVGIDLADSCAAATRGNVPSTSICVIDRTPWFYIEEAQYTVNERGGSLTVRVRRDGYIHHTQTVSVDLDAADDTAVVDDDYTAPNPTATFAAGVRWVEKTFPIVSTVDEREELERFTLSLSNPVFGVIDSSSTATVFIIDESAWFYIEEAQYYVGERAGTLTIRIRRGGYQSDAGTVTVDLDIQGVTATGGAVDYTEPGITLVTFQQYVDYVEKTFVISSDAVREPIETFTVTLDTPTGGGIGVPSTSTVFIMDETIWFYIEEEQYIVGERGTSITVRVRRDGYQPNAGGAVTVDLNVQDVSAVGSGTDYTSPVDTTATFTDNSVEYVDMVFMIEADDIVEDLESFTIKLENPSSGFVDVSMSIITTVYIIDETAQFYFEEESYIVGERTSPLTMRVRREGYQWDAATVTVDINVQDGTATGSDTDYTAPVATTLTFTSGQNYVDVDFAIITDAVVEDLESFTVMLDTPVGGVIGVPITTTVYIIDQTAVFWIEESQYNSFEEEPLAITIRRDVYFGDTDIVTLSETANTATLSTDYALPGVTSMTFNPGDPYVTSMPLTIAADAIVEDIEDFSISITLDPATTATWAVILSPNPTTVYIQDRTAYFWIEEQQYTVSEGHTLDVVFHRGGFLGRPDMLPADGRALVTDDYSLPDDLDVMFASGASTSPKTLTIVSDNTLEHWEDFSISVTIDASSAGTGVLYSPSTASVIIRDPTWYNLDSADYTVWESETMVNIAVRREGDLRIAGSVEISTHDGTATATLDYTPISTAMVVEFDVGVNSVNVPVTISPDDLVEKDESVFIRLSSPATGEALGSLHKGILTIFDDDAYFSLERALYYLDNKEATPTLTVNILRLGHTNAAGSVEINSKDLTALSGEDYETLTNEVVSFESGDDSKPVTIVILDEVKVEDDEWFEICLSNPTQGQVGSPRCATVFIENDDSLISFGDETYNMLENDLRKGVEITLVRTGFLAQAASVEVRTSDVSAEGNTDYTQLSRNVVFATGETEYKFTIPIHDDNIVEQVEVFEIELFNMEGGEIGHPSKANVFLENDDDSYCFADSSYVVSENKEEIYATVIRNGYLGDETSIEFHTVDDTAISSGASPDFTSISSMALSFGRDQATQRVKITIVDDVNHEITEEFKVELSSAVSTDQLCYPNTAVITILSDDAECERECLNGGVCVNPDECRCTEQYTGPTCESDVDECSLLYADVCTDPSLNCVNTYGSYYCECANPQYQMRGSVCVGTHIIWGRLTFVEYNGAPVEFTTELLDITSGIHIRWKTILETELDNVFSSLPGYASVRVRAFYQGSIGVEFEVLADTMTSSFSTPALRDIFESHIDGRDYIVGTTIKAVPNTIYFQDEGCPDNLCLHGGECVVSVSYGYRCLCSFGYAGVQCETIDTTPNRVEEENGISTSVIVSIALAGMVGVLIVVLLLMCVYYINRTSVPMKNRNLRKQRPGVDMANLYPYGNVPDALYVGNI